MGKAFASELAALPDTLAWAQMQDVKLLVRFVADVAERPLVAIGSGGSSTACHLTALLHRTRHHRPAQFMTPLDVLSLPAGLHRAGVFLASASGKNKDVLAALEVCIAEEAPAVAAVTLRADNPLSDARRSRARVFAAEVPRARTATSRPTASSRPARRAPTLRDPVPKARREGGVDGAIFEGRHMVQVLHGGWGAPVATDLESKVNESALASAQLADYRNFGHGRHLWLAKRAAETVVVALVTPGTAAIAESTLKLFPKTSPSSGWKPARRPVARRPAPPSVPSRRSARRGARAGPRASHVPSSVASCTGSAAARAPTVPAPIRAQALGVASQGAGTARRSSEARQGPQARARR